MQRSLVQDNLELGPLWPLQIQECSSSTKQEWFRIVGVAICFGLLSAGGNLFTLDGGRISVFWPANGILVAYMLTRPSRHWWKLLAAATVGNVVAYRFFSPLLDSIVLTLCNMSEVLLASLLLRRGLRRFGDFASGRMMTEFLLYAVFLAPAVGVGSAAVFLYLAHAASPWQTFRLWFPADAIGMALMVPVTLVLVHPEMRSLLPRRNALSTLGVSCGVLAVTFFVFGQSRYFVLYLLFPVLMWVVFEAGVFASFVVLLEILIVGAQFTMHGIGPFWLPSGATMEGSVFRLQLYLLGMMASLVPVGTVLERQRQLQRTLRRGLMRYRLLADNSRDIVVLSSLEGHRLYVSPAVKDVLGWSPEEWTDHDSVELMHPEDIEPFRRMLKEMMHGEDRRTFRYRTRHKEGQYLWMEASMRTLHDEVTHQPDSYVANLREISERVHSEQKLSQAYEQMQQQAQQDGLTGLSNRRRFDEALDAEWRRGRRTGMTLTLLLVDIDNFKRINDTFGHRAGDYCLQSVAGVLRQIARRPSDVSARYGGEEFALLLPDVELATAMNMAERLCQKIREQRIEAGVGSPLTLTVSVGVAAQIPDKNVRSGGLVEAADRALYAAKQAGRDRVVAGNTLEVSAESLYRVH